MQFSSLIEEELESHYANTGSTERWNDLPRQEGKPSGPPFEVQLPEIHWQPTFKESRCFPPSAWPPSFPGSWADLATLCPAVCELRQPVQVRDREVVEQGEGRKRERWWEEGGGPSGARAKRMLSFLGANLINVGQKTELPRAAQSSSTTKQLLSEQKNFTYFPSKAQ